MLLNARQIEQKSAKERIILLAIEDITERRAREDTEKINLDEKQRDYLEKARTSRALLT